MFEFLQSLVVFAISLATLIGAIWALIDCLKRPEGAFTAAGKWSKTVWSIILGVATLLAFVMMPSLGWLGGGGPGVLNLFGIASLVAVIVYFVDVRPKLGSGGFGGSIGGNRSQGGW